MNEGDLLAEIETDKATMGFETPEEGYLAKIIVAAGTKNVAIGKLVCIIVPDESSVAAFKDFKDDTPASITSSVSMPSTSPPSTPPPSTPSPSPVEPPAPAAPSAPKPLPTASGKRIYISPLAKRLAAERGLSLEVSFRSYKIKKF